ncbi:MAG: 50S ribosomal protein L24 [Candidatus Portnoybacteria bacterium CG10_big_fil_rev_8_21_14_0_10_36_7]|uniref:Large ribosomal subunit protein uL24 n=1 Tax=Candidatus Portnoybacteria bacterium CG10_big_fil_rev_8_21_14_0_10_36_7 TaxID=1974812 RepID=A0A2M8KDG5_9BACT|nr:MAG: 50S ribosomal protein L24 [Candidatus Portnoybacteria bacterium CG10_big_fil_rev_8_21_14_0_10_36_7]
MNIKKGDKVLILSGKDRGKTSRVLKALPESERLIVENINMVKKHKKPRNQGEKGQVVLVPRSLHISNAQLICSKCGKPTRVGRKITDKKTFRACKKCNQEF